MALPFRPTWDHELLLPVGMELSVVAASLGGSRSLNNVSSNMDVSGGGFLRMQFDLDLWYPAQHRAYNRMMLYLAGGVNKILMPVLTDWIGPFPLDAQGVPQPWETTGVPHDDETSFSDETLYQQSTIEASFWEDAATNAGTVVLHVRGLTRLLEGGEYFAVRHPSSDWHVYGIHTIDHLDTSGGNQIYTVGIRPTLREAVSADEKVEFSRPLCVMKADRRAPMVWRVQESFRGSLSVVLDEYVPVVDESTF